MSNQLLTAGGLIINRIADQVPGVTVRALSTLVGSQNIAPLLPLVLVSPDAPELGEGPFDGRVITERQFWWVTVVVANVNDPRVSETADERAAPLLDGIVTALLGWRPAPGLQPLGLAQRDAPDYFTEAAEYRLLFQTATVLKGASA